MPRNVVKQPEVEKRSLQEVVGKGYATFWHFKGLECYLMGGKGSKKSKTTALRWIYLLNKYPKACLLVMRKVGDTLRDSAFADLKWAIQVFGLQHEWRAKLSPLSIVNERTGQKIFFRGLDDWQKIASITIDKPDMYLCWGWFEEAFEIDDEDTFSRVDRSIRGKLPEGYFKQIVYSFNPWEEGNYVVKKVCENLRPSKEILEEQGKMEVKKKGIYRLEDKRYKDGYIDIPVERLYMITNYKINEFLSDTDRAVYEEMKVKQPTKYAVEGLGMPGVEPGNIFKEEFPSFKNLFQEAPRLNWRCISVDATFKGVSKNADKGKETDYVAIQSWGIDDKNEFYLVNRIKEHLSFTETLERLESMIAITPNLNAILIEDKANGSAIIDVLRKKYPCVIALEPAGGKQSRAEAVATCFETGAVHLPDRYWTPEYIAEFLAFPNGDHDDEVDATSQALNRLMKITLNRETLKQREERLKQENEYNDIRSQLGLDESIADYISSYTSW